MTCIWPPPRRAARKLKVQINMTPLSSTTFARVRLDELLLDALNDWLRPENVEIVYH